MKHEPHHGSADAADHEVSDDRPCLAEDAVSPADREQPDDFDQDEPPELAVASVIVAVVGSWRRRDDKQPDGEKQQGKTVTPNSVPINTEAVCDCQNFGDDIVDSLCESRGRFRRLAEIIRETLSSVGRCKSPNVQEVSEPVVEILACASLPCNAWKLATDSVRDALTRIRYDASFRRACALQFSRLIRR